MKRREWGNEERKRKQEKLMNRNESKKKEIESK